MGDVNLEIKLNNLEEKLNYEIDDLDLKINNIQTVITNLTDTTASINIISQEDYTYDQNLVVNKIGKLVTVDGIIKCVNIHNEIFTIANGLPKPIRGTQIMIPVMGSGASLRLYLTNNGAIQVRYGATNQFYLIHLIYLAGE